MVNSGTHSKIGIGDKSFQFNCKIVTKHGKLYMWMCLTFPVIQLYL